MAGASLTQKPFSRIARRGVRDDVFRTLRSGPADNLLILGIDVSADTQLNRTPNGKQEYLSGRSQGLQQRGDDDVQLSGFSSIASVSFDGSTLES
jgi:hypothetical protein